MTYHNFMLFIACVTPAFCTPDTISPHDLNRAVTHLNIDIEYKYLLDLINITKDEATKVLIIKTLSAWKSVLQNNHDNHFHHYYKAYAMSTIPTALGCISAGLLVYVAHGLHKMRNRTLTLSLASILGICLVGETIATMAGFLIHRDYTLQEGDKQLKRIDTLLDHITKKAVHAQLSINPIIALNNTIMTQRK